MTRGTACGNKLHLIPFQNREMVARLSPTQPYTNRQGQGALKKNMIHLVIYSMNHLAQTEVFSHQSFVYAFSQSAPQHEGSFVVGLCVGKECDKDFKGLDKSTLSFGGSPVIQQRAKEGWGGWGGAHRGALLRKLIQ